MKKYFSAFCVLALAAGCAKESIAPVQTSDEVLLTSYAGQPQTKTTISGDKTDGFTANWAETDAIGVYTTAGTVNAKHTITLLSDGTAKFTGKVTASEDEQTLYAYYPYTSGATSNPAAALLNLPSVQTMTGTSYDASAAIMIGKPQTSTLNSGTAAISDWQFAHLNSYICISVAGISVEGITENEAVSSVELLAAGKKLSGEMNVSLIDGTMKFSSPADYVQVFVPEGTTLGNLAAWAVTAPFSLDNEYLTIVINTDKHSICKTMKLSKKFISGNVYTLNFSLDGNCSVTGAFDFAKAYTLSERKCYWRGGSANAKTYEVSSTIDWKVSISDPDEATVTKNDDGKSFTVVFPKSKWPVAKKYTVTLEPATAVEGVAPKTMELFLTSAAYKQNGDNSLYESYDDGSVKLKLDSKNSVWLKTSEDFKYGNYVWTFEDVNLTEGFFCVNNWQGGIIYMMLKYGHDTALLACGGETKDANGHKVGFGFDGGWDNTWNDTKKFTEGTFPTDYSQLKSIRLLIKPTQRTGTNQNLTLSRKVWINGTLVLDNSTNVGDIWAADSSIKGFNYEYGIQDAAGSLVIKSFEIDENYSNYND